MSSRIDELATEVSMLNPQEQLRLLERVADLNFKHGLEDLSAKYRKRLADEGKLEQKAEEVLSELEEVRTRIAADEY